jgi:predicted ATPase/class 3 adenylate cyclase
MSGVLVADIHPFSLAVLGPLEARRDGHPIGVGGPRERCLLTMLAINANEVVSTDRLIDAIWDGKPPPTETHTLQSVVSLARKIVDPRRIARIERGYRLDVEPTELDRLRFEALVRAGLGAGKGPDAKAHLFQEALELWRGRPYDEHADREFASAEVTRLEELHLRAIEELASALVESGRAGEAVEMLREPIASAPFRDGLRGVLMLALARTGRTVEATREFTSYRELLAEIGGVPSAELERLDRKILDGEQGFGWEPRRDGHLEGDVGAVPTGTVTFVFTDVVGSTRLWERHQEAMEANLPRHDEIIRRVVESHGGRLVKKTGDGAHLAFATANDAVRAAIQLQLELNDAHWTQPASLEVRIGVHAGEAKLRDGDYDGPVVNETARLMAAAHGGQILCSGAVAELVDGTQLMDLGVHRLDGVASPMRMFQVAAPGLESSFPPLRTVDASRTNLPPESGDLIGRERDVDAVVEALASSRVVSIVGSGGIGKTRLALRVGTDLLADHPDGVWWCELAPLEDPSGVPEAVASAIGFVPTLGVPLLDGLSAFFRHKKLLLVLDNCEHLVAAVADFVTSMIANAPTLTVLTTSREGLRIRDERVAPLTALALPTDHAPASVEASAAGALFALRARQARGSLTVTDENAAAIAEVCARLDANALAIELAAARTTVMSPAEILAHLDQRFRLLRARNRDAAARHKTLEAAIGWSYELLEVLEQRLLQQLSVCVGSFDLSAATAIAAAMGLDEFDTVDRLESLTAKSLLERDDVAGASRSHLLETVRQYAADRLDEAGAVEAARDAHATHFVAAARELFAQLRTPDDFDALEQLRIETPNLAAGLRWLLASNRVDEVVGFFGDAGWIDNGLVPFPLLDELGRVANDALAHEGVEAMDGYVATCFYSGLRAFHVGDTARYEDVVSAANDADPDSLWMVGPAMGVAAMHGDVEAAIEIGARGIAQARTASEAIILAYLLSLTALGELSVEPDAAQAHAREAVDVARTCRATSTLLYPLCQLSMVLGVTGGDPDEALEAAEECIRLDRTSRRAWSTVTESSAALLRFSRGERAAGLRAWSDVVRRFEWSGELGYLAMQLGGIANAAAEIDPAFAVDVAAIADCGRIVPFPVLTMLDGFPTLKAATEDAGSDAIDAARGRANRLSYQEALRFLLDGLARLATQTSS